MVFFLKIKSNRPFVTLNVTLKQCKTSSYNPIARETILTVLHLRGQRSTLGHQKHHVNDLNQKRSPDLLIGRWPVGIF